MFYLFMLYLFIRGKIQQFLDDTCVCKPNLCYSTSGKNVLPNIFVNMKNHSVNMFSHCKIVMFAMWYSFLA